MIPGSRRNLFKDQSFGERDNGGMRADRSRASRAQAKEKVGRRLSAPGLVQGRGARRWGTVVGVCLVPEVGVSLKGRKSERNIWSHVSANWSSQVRRRHARASFYYDAF